MEQRWNVRAEETGDHRENPPARGIVLYDSYKRKSGGNSAGNGTRIALPAPKWPTQQHAAPSGDDNESEGSCNRVSAFLLLLSAAITQPPSFPYTIRSDIFAATWANTYRMVYLSLRFDKVRNPGVRQPMAQTLDLDIAARSGACVNPPADDKRERCHEGEAPPRIETSRNVNGAMHQGSVVKRGTKCDTVTQKNTAYAVTTK
ncbi:hypothetical protein PR048_019955 [Dryococelus australis]|uniref:Uncharacterized protein n=1 Tax=Dryococelus australis TaxID=614101 RepID=A0ABQ9H4X9_9NEOP|nr:hypothetical protein PR048_019955 [Dryococelus australis]